MSLVKYKKSTCKITNLIAVNQGCIHSCPDGGGSAPEAVWVSGAWSKVCGW